MASLAQGLVSDGFVDCVGSVKTILGQRETAKTSPLTINWEDIAE